MDYVRNTILLSALSIFTFFHCMSLEKGVEFKNLPNWKLSIVTVKFQ